MYYLGLKLMRNEQGPITNDFFFQHFFYMFYWFLFFITFPLFILNNSKFIYLRFDEYVYIYWCIT